jgi:TM2 domain-containing membrane protein YozV
MMTESSYSYDHDGYDDRVRVRRGPSPGIAAVLSVLIPGLGQVYNGRLLAGLVWFLATSIGYSAILIPGLLIHVLCVWCAYRDARFWPRY